MLHKYKNELLAAATILLFVLAFMYLRELILPFIFGLLLAVAVDPLIRRMQKWIKNRTLATSLFLFIAMSLITLFSYFSIAFINRDFERLNHSFEILVSQNKDKTDAAGKEAKKWIANFYDISHLKSDLKHKTDSLKKSFTSLSKSELDFNSISGAIEKVQHFFPAKKEKDENTNKGFSTFFMVLLSLLYFVLILYQYDYFESMRKKFISAQVASKWHTFHEDVSQTFVRYLRLRTKIVLMLSLIYATTFIILDMPGMIFLTILIALLSYIPYLQYLALIPIALGSLVVSIENQQHFLLPFCIVSGVFVLISILDDFVLTPYYIDRVFRVNLVILILALSIWAYLFGWLGILLGVPLTRFSIIYLKRYALPGTEAVLGKD